jgi:acyl transferase domain-containing protein/acyl carrier protein
MALVGSSKLIAIPVEGLEETIGIESDDFRTRTFDDNSNGTCPGEGVAAVLLKPLKKALDDGDNIYAVIKGSAINQDGKSMAIAVPNSDAQADVIANAWLDARVNPETISYIETHGTATKLGDPIEVEGLRRAFGKFTDKKQFCAIGAVKTNIGHLDNSSSIAGFMKTVLSLKNKEIPASINYNVPNRKIDFIDSPVFVNYELKSWKTDGMTRRCGITGVGLNGTNCHVVLEEAPEMEMNEPDAPKHGIFTLTAKTERALKEFIKKYKQLVDKKQKIRYRDLVYTTNTGKGQYEYRIAFSYKDEEDFWSKIKLLNPLCLKSNNDYPGVFYKQLEENNAKESIVEYGSPEELSKAFVSGAHIDWDKFYMHEKRRKVSTPTYPFEPTRCWVEVPSRKNASKLKSIEGIIKSNMLPENMEKELREVYEKCMQYLESCESGDEEPASVVVLKGRETDEYSDTEKAVASIWSDMLGYEELNIKHTLYDLGGDSVLALKIVNRINEKLNTTLKVVDLLKNPTIEDISSIAEGLFEKV